MRKLLRFSLWLLAVCLAVLLLTNAGGWRARLIAKLRTVNNSPVVVPAPPGFLPQVPPGFHISAFARGFDMPRWLAIAPNGDVFLADSSVGQVLILRDPAHRGEASSREAFAKHLNLPFGIAFHDNYVYIACTNEVLRFPYDPQTSRRLGPAEHIADLPGLGYHQHWTRSLAFAGNTLFISVGSETNVSVETDPRRAAILQADPDGKNLRIYASGLRNPAGLAVNPATGRLWTAVNERDDLGDDVPSDYLTHVAERGFYGWPYSYLGQHVDDRVSPRPDLVAKALVPDVLLGAHVAPLQFAFYEAAQFPEQYRHGAFLAEHGSWNRRIRSGYQVVFIPFHDGAPAGKPIPFLTGCVPNLSGPQVYARPVGVAVAPDGALLVSDDAARAIWRITR